MTEPMTATTHPIRLTWLPLFASLLLLAAACGEAVEETVDVPAPTGGKGDETLSVAQCEANFEAYEPCPEIDEDTASLEELQTNIACLEEHATSPVWACCEQESLASSAFCTERVEEGRELTCDYAYDDYQACALDELIDLGACRRSFLLWDNENWECCSRLDTGLCDGAREPGNIPDIDALTERIVAADGYFYFSTLFDQMYPVDVLPGDLQESLPLYSNSLTINWLAQDEIEIDLDDPDAMEKLSEEETILALHEVEERLPVSYAVNGFGTQLLESIMGANAYVTFWRTTQDRIVLATHYYSAEHVGLNDGGWVHGPTFVLDGSACDLMDDAAKRRPNLAALAAALDETNGRPLQSCLADHFDPVDLNSPEVSTLEHHLTARYFNSGDDSRINTIEAALRIETAEFRGLFLHMVEIPSQETLDLLGETLEEYTSRRTRLLLNEHGEVVHKFDDEACERDPTYPNTPMCAYDLP